VEQLQTLQPVLQETQLAAEECLKVLTTTERTADSSSRLPLKGAWHEVSQEETTRKAVEHGGSPSHASGGETMLH
jgi:hypothetical protein